MAKMMSEALSTMQELRRSGKREPKKVYNLCQELLKTSLGDEAWTVREELVLASLDQYDLKTAEEHLNALKQRFPNSTRVMKLEGMVLEAQTKYKEALALYKKISEIDPNNQTATKRKAAILKAQGKTEEAITVLSEYLEVFQSDKDAWQELALLNLQTLDYGAAAFCFEDLILFEPGSPSNHLACAEAKFTEDTPRSLLDARKHFSQSLVFKSVENGNLRAAFGLALNTYAINCKAEKVAKALLDDEDAQEIERMNRRLSSWACDEILKESRRVMNPDIKLLVEKVTEKLRI